jgi:tetratricopeptide (TPR) repeat protein
MVPNGGGAGVQDDQRVGKRKGTNINMGMAPDICPYDSSISGIQNPLVVCSWRRLVAHFLLAAVVLLLGTVPLIFVPAHDMFTICFTAALGTLSLVIAVHAFLRVPLRVTFSHDVEVEYLAYCRLFAVKEIDGIEFSTYEAPVDVAYVFTVATVRDSHVTFALKSGRQVRAPLDAEHRAWLSVKLQHDLRTRAPVVGEPEVFYLDWPERKLKIVPAEGKVREEVNFSRGWLNVWVARIENQQTTASTEDQMERIASLGRAMNFHHDRAFEVERRVGLYSLLLEICPSAALPRMWRAELWEELAERFCSREFAKQSVDDCTAGTELEDKDGIDFEIRRANVLLKLKRYEEALDSFAKVISTGGDTAGAHGSLGDAYQAAERFADAIKHYTIALDRAGSEHYKRRMLARRGLAYNKQGDQANCASDWKDVIFTSPSLETDASCLQQMRNHLSYGNYALVVKLANKRSDSIEPAEFHLIRGRALRGLARETLDANMLGEACLSFSRALELQPFHMDVRTELLSLYLDCWRYDLAIATFEDWPEMDHRVPYWRARDAALRGDYTLANDLYEGSSFERAIVRGRLCDRQGALAEFDRVFC